MRRETKLLHYGRPALPGPANPPVVRASTILHRTVESYIDTKARREEDDSVLSYGRRGTTTAHTLMAAVADLEGGEAAYLFPTGVAALACSLSAFVGSGDHLLVVDTVFHVTRKLCDGLLRRNGVSVDYVPWDATDLSPWIRPETKAVVVESPGSQTFEVMDLPGLTRWTRERGLTVIADNTYGSGWLYRPLQLGCDVSVVAGTKYLGGHADVMMGAAAARGPAAATLRAEAIATGQTLAPDEAYATLRGLRTLNLRLERHQENAFALVEWFSRRPEVSAVLHPGLPSHPGADLWARDADGCNGLFSVVFREGFALTPFLNRLEHFAIGASWGGFESVVLPISPLHDRLHSYDLPAGPAARFHAGLEHVDDLIEDLARSFGDV